MRYFKLALLATLLSFNAIAMTKVAIIDTGLDLSDSRFKKVLCKTGHKDFTGEGLHDNHGHGTHVAGLIKQYAEDAEYCLIILKFYVPHVDGKQSVKYEVQAIKEAVRLGATVVNISGGGAVYDAEEYEAIRNAPQVKFIVAAGNESSDVSNQYVGFYPACHWLPNITVVGALDFNEKHKAQFSNYGDKIEYWERGESVVSTIPRGKTASINGTSQATAIATGKFLRGRLVKRKPVPVVRFNCVRGECTYKPDPWTR